MKTLTLTNPAFRQLIRYGIVGIINNLLGYLLYLLVTFLWLEPKVAITLFYPVGAMMGYIGHAKYSFSSPNAGTNRALRYTLAYAAGYGINYMMLLVFADIFAFPHQLVQASAIFVVAGFLFLMLKYFVFAAPKYSVNVAKE